MDVKLITVQPSHLLPADATGQPPQPLHRSACVAARLLNAEAALVCVSRLDRIAVYDSRDIDTAMVRLLPKPVEQRLRNASAFLSLETAPTASAFKLGAGQKTRFKTSLWIPLMGSQRETLGWIGVADSGSRTWTEPDRSLLDSFGSAVAAQITLLAASEEADPLCETPERENPSPENPLETVFALMSDGFIAFDLAWRYVYINETAAAMLDRSVESLLGRNVWAEFPEAVGEPIQQAYFQALASQEPATLEYYFPPWDRWFDNRIYPTAQGVWVHLRDITDRKRSETQLRESEALFRTLFESALTGFIRCTLGGTILDANPEMSRIVGWPLDALRRIPYWELIPEPRRQEEAARIRELDESRRYGPVRSEFLHRDGRHMTVRVAGRLVEHRGEPFLWLGVEDISERVQAEKALAESEQKFRTTFELSASGKALVAPDGRWLQVNRKLCDIVGYSADELRTKTFQDITFPDDLDADLENVQKLLAGEIPSYSMEKRYVRKDGSLIWILLSVALVQDPDGAPRYFIAVIDDISRQKSAEQKLRASEQHLRNVLNSLFAFVGVMTPDGILREANEAALRVANLRREDVVDMPLIDTYWLSYSPAVQARMSEAIAQAIAGFPQRYDERVRVGDDQFIDVDFTICAMYDEAGNATHLVPSAVDITERKRGETLLAREALRWRVLFERANDAMFVIDDSGRVIEANRSFAAMLGCPLDEVLTLHPWDWDTVYSSKEKIDERWPEFPTAGATFETVIRRRNGELFDAEISYNPAEWQDQKQLFFMCRDITARKQSEKRLIEYSHQLELLSQKILTTQEAERRHIARELHDEIGQLLTVIKLDLRNVLRHAKAEAFTPPLKSALAIVDELVAHVRNLSLDLHPSILDDLGLVPALRWYTQRQQQHLGTPVALVLPAQHRRLPATIETACFRIVQEALTNIARHAHASQSTVELKVDEKSVAVSISDNGVGFAVNRVKNGSVLGAGFGLLSMQERAQLVGGRLEVASQPGNGSVITATFSLAESVS